MSYYKIVASRIPEDIRKYIIQEKFIENSNVYSQSKNSPMGFLFDMYEKYIDVSGEHDDWNCPKCKLHIIEDWQKLLPFLYEIEQEVQNVRSDD